MSPRWHGSDVRLWRHQAVIYVYYNPQQAEILEVRKMIENVPASSFIYLFKF